MVVVFKINDFEKLLTIYTTAWNIPASVYKNDELKLTMISANLMASLKYKMKQKTPRF